MCTANTFFFFFSFSSSTFIYWYDDRTKL